jgi:CBS domain-containing protein
MGMSYACAPGVNLLTQPWISPGHVLRAFVWMQFVVGVVNLLPAAALPTRQMLRGGVKTTTPTVRTGGPAFSLMTGLAIAMLLGGLVTTNLWLILLGCFALLGSQLQSQTAPDGPSSDGMRVEEVMLTEFITLSSSDTLRGALERTVHSLQDVFPVLRGNRLVGSVTRQTLAEQLQAEGDSYVQGVMTRSLQVAGPQEQLVSALRRAGTHGASEFIPVAEDSRVLGILTPQSLTRAVHQVKQTRPPVEAKEPR